MKKRKFRTYLVGVFSVCSCLLLFSWADVVGQTITTYAGIGPSGPFGSFSGDGGMATLAGLYGPSGVAINKSGDLYIGDYFNYRIRKVNTSGIITTIGGNGLPGYAGDGGPATAAQLQNPGSIVVDSGGTYIWLMLPFV